MYVKSLRINNFKCFGRAHLNFHYPDSRKKSDGAPNVNLILGDNGGGKSSILRAVAIAMLGGVLLGSGFVPYRLVRRPGAKEGSVHLDGVATEFDRFHRKSPIPFRARLARGPSSNDFVKTSLGHSIMRVLYDDYSPNIFLAGYGATRWIETGDFSKSSARKSRAARYQRVASLFEDRVSLQPLEYSLLGVRRRSRSRSEVVRVLNNVLPSNIRFNGDYDVREEQFIFEFEGRHTPFSALSDGYKAFIGWTGELIGQLSEVAHDVKLDEIPGIVLVDEIDLHLHPEWQREVIPTLASAFPRIQFICTTHSPLVANNVHSSNIFLTENLPNGTATVWPAPGLSDTGLS